MTVEHRPVIEMLKHCTLDMRDKNLRLRGGFAASDQCRAIATSAVIDDRGYYLPRCSAHAGIISLVLGPVSETMPVALQEERS